VQSISHSETAWGCKNVDAHTFDCIGDTTTVLLNLQKLLELRGIRQRRLVAQELRLCSFEWKIWEEHRFVVELHVVFMETLDDSEVEHDDGEMPPMICSKSQGQLVEDSFAFRCGNIIFSHSSHLLKQWKTTVYVQRSFHSKIFIFCRPD